MESRALGKGLSALIPERSAVSKSETVTQVNISDISENSLQPRTNYDDEKLTELISSIKENGVLQPILVRPKGAGFEVIAGERRLRAVKALKIEQVPVIVKDVTDQEALVLALVENIQRQELNAIEEAHAFQRLISEFNFTQDAVAKSVGKNRSSISNIVRLLKLPAEIQKSVFDGILSEGHARTLLGVENAQEQKKLFERTVARQLSVRELENLVKYGVKGGHRWKKKSSSRETHLIAIEEDLQKSLGTKVRIMAQKKRGKIIIEYYSPDDLERITGIIKK